MKIGRSALVLGTILALAAAVYVLTRSDQSRALSPRAASLEVAADGARLERSVLESATTPETQTERSATDAPAVEAAARVAADDSFVRGRAVDEAGRPVRGASITIDYKPGDDFNILDLAYSHQEIPVGETRTDAEGAFAMAVPPDWPVRVHARAEGFSRAMLTDIFAGAEVLIVLGPSARLIGRITRALDGTPVEGAELHLFRMGGPTYETVRSDADGGYRLDDVPPGLATLEINTSWLADPEWTSIDLPSGITVVHDVALEEGVSVFGVVSDAQTGAPIADAEIGAGWFLSRPVRTSSAGEYELRGFGGPGVYEVFVRARGYADARHEFPYERMPSERTQVDFALETGRRAHGVVLDPAGSPLEGVYAAAVSDGGGNGTEDWKSTRTDAAGRFVLESLSPMHQHGLLLRADGWANLAYAFPLDEREHADFDLGTFTLSRPGAISGTVVNEDGEPIGDASVSLGGANSDSGKLMGGVFHPNLPHNLASRSVRTDSRGRFHFGDLAAGDFRLSAARRSGAPCPGQPVTLAAGERVTGVRVVLPTGGTIRGRVETPDGRPVAGAYVNAEAEGRERRSDDWWLRARCESGGTFRIDGLAEESYTLVVDPTYFDTEIAKDCALTLVTGVRAGAEIVIRLAEAEVIEGRVLGADDRPAEGTWVVADLEERNLDSDYCDADGRFRLRAPRGSTVRVQAFPTVRTNEAFGWEILNDARGDERSDVLAGSEGLVLRLPAR